jgi:hypothetical protein
VCTSISYRTLGTAVHHLCRRLLRVQGTPLPCPSQRTLAYPPQTKLFISSQVPIYQVFSDDSANGEISDHMRSVMDDLVSPTFCPTQQWAGTDARPRASLPKSLARAPCLPVKKRSLRLLVRVRGSFKWGAGSGPRAPGVSSKWRCSRLKRRCLLAWRWINHSHVHTFTLDSYNSIIIISFHSMEEKWTLETSIHQRLIWVPQPRAYRRVAGKAKGKKTTVA